MANAIARADLILRGEWVRTVDARDRIVDALAIAGDRIVAAGTEMVLAGLGRRVERGPYGGRVVAAHRDPRTGAISSGSDPRGGVA